MARAVSVFSTAKITADDLGELMTHLKAEPDEYGWVLTRNERSIFIELGTDSMDEFPEDLLEDVVRELGGHRSRVVLMFNDDAEDELEHRMARAVAIAMAESWKVVWNDHADLTERIYAPGRRPSDN